MPSITSSGVLIIAIFISLVLSTKPVRAAQEESKKDAARGHGTVSDKDLKAFAQAYVEYHKIRQTYEQRLVKTKDLKEKQRIQKEGDEKVAQTLKRYSLTPQSYNRVFETVNGDEKLRQKALNLITQERNKS